MATVSTSAVLITKESSNFRPESSSSSSRLYLFKFYWQIFRPQLSIKKNFFFNSRIIHLCILVIKITTCLFHINLFIRVMYTLLWSYVKFSWNLPIKSRENIRVGNRLFSGSLLSPLSWLSNEHCQQQIIIKQWKQTSCCFSYKHGGSGVH